MKYNRFIEDLNYRDNHYTTSSSGYIYIYIYIYVYCHPQTDCFIVLQFFRVCRPTRCFKLVSKPGWIYISQISYPRAINILCVSEGILYVYLLTYMLLAIWSAQFLKRIIAFQYMWQQISPLEVSTYIYIYIYN